MIKQLKKCFLLTLLPPLLFLQVSAQNALTPNSSVVGRITNAGDAETWGFSGLRDQVFSFRVTGDSTLDPIITIYNENGTEIIANDDYAYPESRDALLEAITLPVTGNYTLVVTGYGDSTGEYTLTMLPGYSELALDATFTVLEAWEFDENLDALVEDNEVTLSLEGALVRGMGITPVLHAMNNYYTQVNVEILRGNNGWQAGLVLQQQANGDAYITQFDQRGQWRLVRLQEAERIQPISDWTPHPAIIPGETSFTIGVIVNKGGFDVFYNGQLLNRLDDSAIDLPGNVGLWLETPNALDSQVSARFADFILTRPTEVNNAPVFPTRLVPGNSTLVTEELERRHVIPTNGQMLLSIDETFLEFARPGTNVLPLGRGTRFRNYALSMTTELRSVGEGIAGCGILLRYTESTAYMVAYLDNAGGYGVSERQGERFLPGLYGENDQWVAGTAHTLLVVVNNDILHYYINSVYVGSLEVTPLDGQIGNILLNFDPVESTCQFRDIWLWGWD